MKALIIAVGVPVVLFFALMVYVTWSVNRQISKEERGEL